MAYKPHDKVPFSGIYTVTHDPEHRKEHDVTCIEGSVFPPCRSCAHPRYVLKERAKHIKDDQSFKAKKKGS
jgi:hypothetical protein